MPLLTVPVVFLCGALVTVASGIGATPVHSRIAIASAVPRSDVNGEPIQPIQASVVDPEKAALGAKLFVDKRLSRDNTVACADCHDLDRGGADGRRTAIGIGGALGAVNTPTIFNADLNAKQFWDGRADSLESQIDGPIQHPAEMGSTWPEVVAKLKGDDAYARAFWDVYRDQVAPEHVKDAIAAFERTLVTPGSRFDRYVLGNQDALLPVEIEGYTLFKRYGCISCHQGHNVGGNVFESLGIMGDYFAARGGKMEPSDLGRFNVTHRDEDRFKFRVPSLRMVSRTAPYFHDGNVDTLDEAVRLMGRYQLGEEIPAHDVAAIVAFLGSLAGERDPGRDHANR